MNSDPLYVLVSSEGRPGGRPSAHQVDMGDGVIIDLDADRHVLGVEFYGNWQIEGSVISHTITPSDT